MTFMSTVNTLLCPIVIEPDPMEFLFLYNFEGDEIYNGFEYQYFDNPVKGQGSLAIMWRKDGKVDYYMTPGVRLNREHMNVASGIGEWITQDFSSHYDVTAHGLDFELDLTLKDGRPLHVELRENRRHAGKPMTILAPMGAGIEAPVYMPIFWLKDIDLVRVKNTLAEIKIGEQSYAPIRIPIPIPYNRSFSYFSRYCMNPFMVTINPALSGRLPTMTPDTLNGFTHEGMQYDLVQISDKLAIERIRFSDASSQLSMRFTPALPDLLTLGDNVKINGSFQIDIDDVEGVIRGAYDIMRTGDTVKMQLWPTENWQPHGTFMERLTLRMFPSVFRTWPRTYLWSAIIDLSGAPDQVTMQSEWRRIEQA